MNTETSTPVYITRDGKHVATLAHENDVLGWFVRNTNFSMDYALTHDGYAITTELPPIDGLNGYTVAKAKDIPVGRIPGEDYGYKRDLVVTVSIRMERNPRFATTVDHAPIVDHLDFSITTSVWRPDRTDIVSGGATIDPLLQVIAHGRYEDGWDAESVAELVALAPWHLNALTAACSHMDADTLVREPDGFGRTRIACGKANTCPESGYTYGAAWLVRPLPSTVLDTVRRLIPSAIR